MGLSSNVGRSPIYEQSMWKRIAVSQKYYCTMRISSHAILRPYQIDFSPQASHIMDLIWLVCMAWEQELSGPAT